MLVDLTVCLVTVRLDEMTLEALHSYCLYTLKKHVMWALQLLEQMFTLLPQHPVVSDLRLPWLPSFLGYLGFHVS